MGKPSFFMLSWVDRSRLMRVALKKFRKTKKPSSFLKSSWSEHKNRILEILSHLEKRSIGWVSQNEEHYPEVLKTHPEAPFVLCFYGNLELLKKTALTFVGSRQSDAEALYWLDQNVPEVSKNWLLASGGARGIDQGLHKAALRHNKETLVVLPSGILNPYPLSLKALWQNEPDRLFISAFPPEVSVHKAYFYPRNHLLALLSEALIVVQARLKSGSMVTAQFAIDLHKDIYTLPASPWDQRYQGNLKLLEEGANQITDLFLFR